MSGAKLCRMEKWKNVWSEENEMRWESLLSGSIAYMHANDTNYLHLHVLNR